MKISVLVSVLLLSGCATAVTKYAVTPENEPYSFFQNGTPQIVSEGQNSRVTFGPAATAQDAAGRQLFVLTITNLGKQSFNIGPEIISVQTNDGKEIAVATPERLQKEANRTANSLAWSAALQSISNNLDAASAGYSSGHGTYSGRTNVYGTYGSAYANTSGTVSYSSYDSSAAAQARIAANAENRALQAEYSARIADVRNNAQNLAFQRESVRPGETITAPVLFDALSKKATEVDFVVTVAGEQHSFAWNFSVE